MITEKMVVQALMAQLLIKAFAVCRSFSHLPSRVKDRLELQEGNEGSEQEGLGERFDRIDRGPDERHKRKHRSRG
jgi:hypothetical protein